MGVFASVAALSGRSRSYATDWSLKNRALCPLAGALVGAASVLLPALLVSTILRGSFLYPLVELVGDPLVSAVLLGFSIGCALEFGDPRLLAGKRRQQILVLAFALNAASTLMAKIPFSGLPLAPGFALLIDLLLLRDHSHPVPAARRKLLRASAALAALYFSGRLLMYFMFTVVGFLMGFGIR